MTEAISKAKLLEWASKIAESVESMNRDGYNDGYVSALNVLYGEVQKGRFDISATDDGIWKAISEIVQRENAELHADIGELEQENRLQAARNERLEKELEEAKAKVERQRERKYVRMRERDELREKLNQAMEALELISDDCGVFTPCDCSSHGIAREAIERIKGVKM